MRFIVGFFGKAGSGKSFMIDKIMDDLPRPVFVLDTQNEFYDGIQFESAFFLREYLIEGYPNVSGIYVLNTTSDADFDQFFQILVTGQFPATVVIDEADMFCTPHAINEDLNRIISYGRHWEQNIIYAARRAAEVSRKLTAQSDAIISFKQTEPRDIASLKKSYSVAGGLSELDETKFEYMILGRSEHLPFAQTLSSGALTNTVPNFILPSEIPESLEITEDPAPEERPSQIDIDS